MKITVEMLAAAALRVEQEDPIDFGELSIREDDAFVMMSRHVLAILEAADDENKELVLAASIVKLLVENFVLQTHLLQASYAAAFKENG